MSDSSMRCKASGLSAHKRPVSVREFSNCLLLQHVNHEDEVGTNSLNVGMSTDQWPVAQFLGKSKHSLSQCRSVQHAMA